MAERKDVTIHAMPAPAFARAPKHEELLHHCPLCNETFGWEKFKSHAKGCAEAHPERIREIRGGKE